jgi:hypothetical protein
MRQGRQFTHTSTGETRRRNPQLEATIPSGAEARAHLSCSKVVPGRAEQRRAAAHGPPRPRPRPARSCVGRRWRDRQQHGTRCPQHPRPRVDSLHPHVQPHEGRDGRGAGIRDSGGAQNLQRKRRGLAPARRLGPERRRRRLHDRLEAKVEREGKEGEGSGAGAGGRPAMEGSGSGC